MTCPQAVDIPKLVRPAPERQRATIDKRHCPVDQPPAPLGAVDKSWQVQGIGDYNGDGREDVMFRNDFGVINNLLATASGGYTSNAGSVVNVSTWLYVQDPFL